MDSNKEVKKYFNKYFKAQCLKENDNEYKYLVKLLNKALRQNPIINQDNDLYKEYIKSGKLKKQLKDK